MVENKITCTKEFFYISFTIDNIVGKVKSPWLFYVNWYKIYEYYINYKYNWHKYLKKWKNYIYYIDCKLKYCKIKPFTLVITIYILLKSKLL